MNPVATTIFKSNHSRLRNHPRCKRSCCWRILYNFTLKLLLN